MKYLWLAFMLMGCSTTESSNFNEGDTKTFLGEIKVSEWSEDRISATNYCITSEGHLYYRLGITDTVLNVIDVQGGESSIDLSQILKSYGSYPKVNLVAGDEKAYLLVLNNDFPSDTCVWGCYLLDQGSRPVLLGNYTFPDVKGYPEIDHLQLLEDGTLVLSDAENSICYYLLKGEMGYSSREITNLDRKRGDKVMWTWDDSNEFLLLRFANGKTWQVPYSYLDIDFSTKKYFLARGDRVFLIASNTHNTIVYRICENPSVSCELIHSSTAENPVDWTLFANGLIWSAEDGKLYTWSLW